uniref:Uncharacterized protein n=1 Tax=Serinus canaria TaxID=9135 RepID=A0A8C9L6K0_SERCA
QRARRPQAVLQGTGGCPHRPRAGGRVVSPRRGRVPPQLREPQGFPGFLLFLCRLLSPVLQSYGRAVQFLERPLWPQPGVEGFPQQPLPPVAPHLPVPGAHVVGHREAQ